LRAAGATAILADMTLFSFRCLITGVLFACPLTYAQQAADAGPAGVVTGVITCGDTQRPARFASVTLAPVSTPKPKLPRDSDKAGDKDDPAVAMKMLGSMMSSMTMLQAQTGLDGSYTVEGVPPGDYYLSANAPGYVSPVLAAMQAAAPGATGKSRFAGVPVVHVEANHTARGDFSLERGAAVSGVVTYDDGSPAMAVTVMLQSVDADKKKSGSDMEDDDFLSMMPLMMGNANAGGIAATTDDRGHFRLAGTAPGEYRLMATIAGSKGFSMRGGVIDTSSLHATPLLVYAPSALHKKDATTFTLKLGDERTDIEVRADLSGMHTVSGRVASIVDHHLLNAGTVTLVDTTDKDFNRSGTVDHKGNFLVSYVPSGTYTLTVTDGADTEPAKKAAGTALMRFAAPKTVRSYEEGSQPLIVATSDVVGVSVELKESKTVKKDFDMNDLMKSTN
jgi:hypothetical protein